MLNRMSGTDIAHVPYKGTGPAITDLRGGNVEMTFTTAPPLLAHIRSGKLRAIAVTGNVALPSLPNVPATATIKRYEKLDVSSWFAVDAPANTPKPIIDRLTGDIKTIMATDAFKRKAQEQGAYAVYMTPQELAAHTGKEFQMWGKFVKDARITGE